MEGRALRSLAGAGEGATAAPTAEARADEPAPAVVVLRDIEKQLGGRPILQGIDLTVERGRSVWVRGSNGVGKTTLLRIVAGLITADRGSIRLEGLAPESQRSGYQRRVGFLGAGDRGLYARLSVRQNLDFWARIAFVGRSGRKSSVERALERFSLRDLAGRRVDRLSTGQRQRVRLAMTFLHGPPLVLLDEPAASLDEEGIALLLDALGELTANGGSAICCSPPNAPRLGTGPTYRLETGRLRPS